MTRTIARRLKLLETRAKIEMTPLHDHVLCFVDTNKRVVRTFEMATRKWTHFDPPQERAGFEPIV